MTRTANCFAFLFLALPAAPAGDLGADCPGYSQESWEKELVKLRHWWDFNRDRHLQLKRRVWLPAGETWTNASDWIGPSEASVRGAIVPALLAILRTESDPKLLSPALIALARIGDHEAGSDALAFEAISREHLRHEDPELRAAAVLALGLLGHSHSIPVLASLLADDDRARDLLFPAADVPIGMRARAAYALGLIGARAETSATERKQIVAALAGQLEPEPGALEQDSKASADFEAACIIALGLTPSEDPGSWVKPGQEFATSSCRVGQLRFLLRFLADDANPALARAQCPTALARLATSMTGELRAEWHSELLNDFESRIRSGDDEHVDVVRSAVLALGILGDRGSSGVAPEIRRLLGSVPALLEDEQARYFSLIAIARAWGNPGLGNSMAGLDESAEFLLAHLEDGKSKIQGWAAISIGILAEHVLEARRTHPFIERATRIIERRVAGKPRGEILGAYALAAGWMQANKLEGRLVEHLSGKIGTVQRGHVALGLGLMNAASAEKHLVAIMKRSRYRPDLMQACGTALGMLGNREAEVTLEPLLREEYGLATIGYAATTLASIGGEAAVNPLIAALEQRELRAAARGLVAAALGDLADTQLLPWTSLFTRDLNYRASPPTLVELVFH